MTPTRNPDQILIVGSGFACFWAALAARRVAGPRAEVILVSRQPVLEIRPRLSDAKARAIATLRYYPVARLLLQARSRFWRRVC